MSLLNVTITMIITADEAVRQGITETGLIVNTDRPAELLNITSPCIHTSRMYYELSWGVYYYDPSTQMVRSYPIDRSFPISKHVPAAFIPWITSTTPFFVYRDSISVYMRSFIWTFGQGILKSKEPIVRAYMNNVVDFNLPLNVRLLQYHYEVRQASARYMIHRSYHHNIKIMSYKPQFRVMDYSPTGSQLVFNVALQRIVFANRNNATTEYLVEPGYTDYTIYDRKVWAIKGDRLIVVPMVSCSYLTEKYFTKSTFDNQ